MEISNNRMTEPGRLDRFLKSLKPKVLELIFNLCGISGGLSILIFSGMQLGWNMFFLHVFHRFGPLAWLISAACGSLSSLFLIKRTTKRNLYISQLLSILICSVILMFIRIVFLLGFCDLVGGFICGLTYTAIISQVQSINHSGKKGILVTFIHLALMLGVLFGQLAYEFDRHTAIRNLGVFSFFLANIGILLTFFLGQEDVEISREDLHAMQPISSYQVTQNDGEANRSSTSWIFAVFFHCLLKLSFCLTFNILLNSMSLFKMETSFSNGDQVPISQHSLACLSQLYRFKNGIIFISFRILGILLALLTVDFNRRVNLVFLVFSAICLIVLSVFDLVTYRYTKIVQSVFQLLCGFSTGFLSDVFAAEKLDLPGVVTLHIFEFFLQSILFVPFVLELATTEWMIAGFRGISGLTVLIIGITINAMAKKLPSMKSRSTIVLNSDGSMSNHSVIRRLSFESIGFPSSRNRSVSRELEFLGFPRQITRIPSQIPDPIQTPATTSSTSNQPQHSRTGRIIKKPSHFKDFVMM